MSGILSLEQEVQKAHWGYIFLNTDGTFSYANRISSSQTIQNLDAVKEMILTLARVFFSDRRQLFYQGMISWFRTDEGIHEYGVLTRAGTDLADLLRLTREFERIATLSNADYAFTATNKPEAIMRREGWELVEPGLFGFGSYRKEINIQ